MHLALGTAALLFSVGVFMLSRADRDGVDVILCLLAFPIWLVAKDLGGFPGAVFGACLLAAVGVAGAASYEGFSALGFLVQAAVFAGAVALGAQGEWLKGIGRHGRERAFLRLLTVKPEVMPREDVLSHRELEVLEKVATGAKNAEIAAEFVISENTVKSHVRQILKKLSVANRTEAARRYVDLYGDLRPMGGGSTAEDGLARETSAAVTATSALKARVAASPERDRVLLRVNDGRSLEVPMLDPVRDSLEDGSQAIVYFDQQSRIVGWYLPGAQLGVDMRHWTP